MVKLNIKRMFKGVSCGFLLSLVLFMGSEVALFKLAYWQFNRMNEKNAARDVLLARADMVIDWPARIEDVGKKVILRGRLLQEKTHVLEHQRLGERAGWRVLTPLALDNGDVVILDRGWLAYGVGDARIHPDFSVFAAADDKVDIAGVVRALPVRKGGIGGPIVAADDRVMVFLDGDYVVGGTYGHGVYVESLTPTIPAGVGVMAVASPLPQGSKHQEYMLTWLGLALILPFLYFGAVLVGWRARKKPA